MYVFFRHQEQYIVIHDAVVEGALCGHTHIFATKLHHTIREMSQISRSNGAAQVSRNTGKTGFQEQFTVRFFHSSFTGTYTAMVTNVTYVAMVTNPRGDLVFVQLLESVSVTQETANCSVAQSHAQKNRSSEQLPGESYVPPPFLKPHTIAMVRRAFVLTFLI